MEQDTANSGEGFAPEPLEDLLRRDPPEREVATGGQPEAAETPPQVAETGEAETAAPEPKDGPSRDAAGRFAPKEPEQAPEATGSPPAEQNVPPQHVPASVLVEERRKWQARVRELETRLIAPQPPQPAPMQQVHQQPASPPVPLSDLMFQNPDAFVQTFEERQQKALLDTRIALSEAAARQQFADYDQAEEALEAYAKSSPAARMEVARLLASDPAPAFKAYRAGKHLLEQRPEAVEARINAEVERRLAARMTPAAPASPLAPPKLPGTLADVRSAGARTAAQTPSFEPLSEIVRLK